MVEYSLDVCGCAWFDSGVSIKNQASKWHEHYLHFHQMHIVSIIAERKRKRKCKKKKGQRDRKRVINCEAFSPFSECKSRRACECVRLSEIYTWFHFNVNFLKSMNFHHIILMRARFFFSLSCHSPFLLFYFGFFHSSKFTPRDWMFWSMHSIDFNELLVYPWTHPNIDALDMRKSYSCTPFNRSHWLHAISFRIISRRSFDNM